jgi:reactive intermediate/imine deaminase
MKLTWSLLTALWLTAAGSAYAVEIEHHPFPSEKPPPLADAVRVGDLLILSGKLGIAPGTRQLVEGGIGPETRQTMENIKAAVEKYGSDMSRVVKCTVFLADMSEWAAMNAVYGTYFSDRPPARSAVGVNGLALNARVEIECMAAIKP